MVHPAVMNEIGEAFQLFDLTSSGTVDEYDDLRQLTLDLVSTFDVLVKSAQIDERVKRFQDPAVLGTAPLTLETFTVWFASQVLDNFPHEFDTDGLTKLGYWWRPSIPEEELELRAQKDMENWVNTVEETTAHDTCVEQWKKITSTPISEASQN